MRKLNIPINKKSFSSLIAITLFIILFFQNCSDPTLSKIENLTKYQACLDADSELRIIRSTTGSNLPTFQIYKRDSMGSFLPFTPLDSTSIWPPSWYKDNQTANPDELISFQGTSGVIYKTEINNPNCAATEIKAQIHLCGATTPIALIEPFVNPGTCLEACVENGVTALENERGRFYKRSQATCIENCDFIDRRCVRTNGQLAFETASQDGYVFATCLANTSICEEEFEGPNCTPPLSPTPSSITLPWPRLRATGSALRTQTLYQGEMISHVFVAGNEPSGQIDSSGYPLSGNDGGFSGLAVVSISKSAGCMDANLLPPNCVSAAATNPGLAWVNKNIFPDSLYACKLTPGETYRLNIYFGSSFTAPPGQPYCPPQIDNGAWAPCGRDFFNQVY